MEPIDKVKSLTKRGRDPWTQEPLVTVIMILSHINFVKSA